VVITGASSGVGRAAAVAIGLSGAHVVLVVRNLEKGQLVADAISSATGDAHRCSIVQCDLASFDGVRTAAALIIRDHPRVDVLINNAGLIASERSLTVDGHELTFQVNHLSHFLLTDLLMSVLVASGTPHVINVSSDAHFYSSRGMNFGDLGFEAGWTPFRAYSQSKLANIMFAYELAARGAHQGVRANAMHPGVVDTGFGAQGWGLLGVLWQKLIPKITAEKSAETLIMLAEEPPGDAGTGGYYYKSRMKASSPASNDRSAQARLWDASQWLVSGGSTGGSQ
jgi:NAD(P)-dependent dehydrogenase (short-subunit alcohol dehydrogenase family)